jgi:hypothetical protein
MGAPLMPSPTSSGGGDRVDFWTLIVALVVAGGLGCMVGNSMHHRFRRYR